MNLFRTILLLTVVALSLACIPRNDLRTKELITLRTIRIAADAAFATHYKAKSEALRVELKAQKKTYLIYLTHMHDLNLVQAEVVRLIENIDRVALFVFNQIRTNDQDQTLILYLGELVSRLVRVVTEAGVQLYER